MPMIEARDGTEIYYKDWGEGRPVILIHGWALSADIWDDHALTLAEAGFRAISYDRRGFGRSGQPWDGYHYDTFADDLADLIEAAAIGQDIALVGFSMGSGEVARYMSRHGGRGVTQAALVAPVVPHLLKGPDNPHGFDPDKFERMTGQLLQDRADFFRSYVKDHYGVGVISHPVSNAVLDWSWRIAMQAGLRPLLGAREAFGKTDFRADLPAFNIPTLIVAGTGDTEAPTDATARVAAKKISYARLIEYEGAPHGLVISHKDRLIPDLLEFLAAGS